MTQDGREVKHLRQELKSKEAELKEREGECRMLKAALAGTPKVVVKPARQLHRSSTTVGTQTDDREKKMSKKPKPKRPSSADSRPTGMRTFIDFSPEDVVDRSRPSFSGVTTEIADIRTGGRDAKGFGPAITTPPSRPTQQTALHCHPVAVPPPMASQMPPVVPSVSSKPVVAPETFAIESSGASSAWLKATTALTADELTRLSTLQQAYEVFLAHDPRAADIWLADRQKLQAEKKRCMMEAKTLGEEIQRSKEATSKVQAALETLKSDLRTAEAEAAVNPTAGQRAEVLRTLLAGEEPKLQHLFDERRQRYELDFARLKELKREISHLDHEEKQLESTIKAEFGHWLKVVEQRYPEAGKTTASACEEGDLTASTSGSSSAPSSGILPQKSPPSSSSSPVQTLPASGRPGHLPRQASPAVRAVSPRASPRAPVASKPPTPPVLTARQASPTLGGLPPLQGPNNGSRTASPSRTQKPEASVEQWSIPPRSPPVHRSSGGGTMSALNQAEAALASLRTRLVEAEQCGDMQRQQMLRQLLAIEEPRLARLREQHS